MNSFYALLGLLAFITLSYATLVRVLFNRVSGAGWPSRGDWWAAVRAPGFLAQIAKTLLFQSLPALSLLLFWGWGPALLWWVIVHLLLETPLHFLLANSTPSNTAANESSPYSRYQTHLIFALYLAVLVLVIAVLVSFLANLVDQQTGLLFTLIGVFVSIHLLRQAHGAVDAVIKLGLSLGVMAFSFLMTQHMGIAIFGEWAPAEQLLPWLVADNRTILALLILVSIITLSKDQPLVFGLGQLTGGLLCISTLWLLWQVAWQQAPIDAPLTRQDAVESGPPLFVALVLLLSPIALGLLRLLDLPKQSAEYIAAEADANTSVQRLLQNQLCSLFALIFIALSTLTLATAAGIGAWSSHYLEWQLNPSLFKHFDLTLKSLESMLTGAISSDSFAHTLFTIVVCLSGLSALMYSTTELRRHIQQGEEVQNPKSSNTGFTSPIQYWSMGLIFIISCWLLDNGIPLTFWISLMLAAWVLMCSRLFARSQRQQTSNPNAQVWHAFALTLAAVGVLQCLGLTISAALDARWFATVVYGGLLASLIYLCITPAVHSFKQLAQPKSRSLFDR